MTNGNGWMQKGAIAVIAALLGMSGTMLLRHDQSVGLSATQAQDIVELKAFKARIDQNVEEWRGDQAAFRLRMTTLETESATARREREAMFRWMERVSMKLSVQGPTVPQRGFPMGSAGLGASLGQ